MIVFKQLEIGGWRQFQKIEVSFHPRLTILTGANGAGKTTVLNILNRHYGWNIHFVATPEKDSEHGKLRYITGWWDRLFGKPREQENVFGKIVYNDDVSANLVLPKSPSGSQYQPQITGMRKLHGLHIPSHRPIFSYQSVGNIPTQPPSRANIAQVHTSHIMGAFQGGGSGQIISHMKQTLIALALFGEGNKYVSRDYQALQLFEGFQEILKKMLPPELGFESLQIENPEVVLRTRSGNFTLDAVSGGIASVIDLSWQIFMSIEGEKVGVVTIDEPENHLHPKLQRTLLPNLLGAFPKTQFIVVTHNPVVVTSVPESNVYAFDFNSENKVESRWLDFANKAADANETLRDVLGLSTASPLWVEQKIAEIIAKHSGNEMDEGRVKNMRDELARLGLERVFPATLSKTWKSK